MIPKFLVLGSDNTIGAYEREDILRSDLAANKAAGDPARMVWEDAGTLSATYRPAPQFAEFLAPDPVLAMKPRSGSSAYDTGYNDCLSHAQTRSQGLPSSDQEAYDRR